MPKLPRRLARKSRPILCLAIFSALTWFGPGARLYAQDAQALMVRADEDLLGGRVTEAVTGFNRLAALLPAQAPYLWQRGIALYYAGQFRECRLQFESHRLVNPDDVENAAWHFLCQGIVHFGGACGASAGGNGSAKPDARGVCVAPG
jgi:hypothetical protein